MADSSKLQLQTSDGTRQKQLLRITKLKLPTLEADTVLQTQLMKQQTHFYLVRSEANKGAVLLSALFSNEIFRIPKSCGAQGSMKPIQKPPFIQKNPLDMLAALFSEIKQELVVEARKFSLIQSEYIKECIRRSRMPAMYRNIRPPLTETANTSASQLKNNLSFLVRLLFEIMEGPEGEGIQVKGACDMPSLPDLYSTEEPKGATCQTPSLPADTSVSVKQLTDSTSFNCSPVSGFNSLFGFGINRK